MSEIKQLSLFKAVGGEGDGAQMEKPPRSTVAIQTHAQRLNTEVNIASVEYERLKHQWIEYQAALKKTSHMKEVKIGEHWMNRDSVVAIVKFLDSYQSKQCERIGVLLRLCRELNARGANIDLYTETLKGWDC